MVESAEVDEIFDKPMHPYTQALLKAVPVPDPERKVGKVVLTGAVPSARHPPSGCRFHTRCPFAKEICKEKEPPLIKLSDKHYISCHMYS